jgi:double zinc ribbon protein
MAQHIPFTDNYEDLSTDRGFQFRFFCEHCGNGYMSSFQHNVTGLAGDALRVAGNFLGGFLGRAADSAYDIQQAVGGPAHDSAVRKAVEEIRPLFHQCGRCGQWNCKDICWNTDRNQCVQCSPKIDEEIAAIESEATIDQIRNKAYNEVDLTGGVQLKSVAAPVQCPSCSTKVPVGMKFCGECGTNVLAKPKCPSCGTEAGPGLKFCGECGTRIK